MSSPFRYKPFRRFSYSVASFTAVRQILQLTVFWLLASILPAYLYGIVIGVRPLILIGLSPIGGYISDKYGRVKPTIISRLISSVLLIPLMYAFIARNIALIILVYFIRAFFQDLSNSLSVVLNYAVLPNDAREKAMFYLYVISSSFDATTVLIWPFLFNLINVYILFLAAIGYAVSSILLIGINVPYAKRNVSISTGYKLFKKNNAAKAMILGLSIDQGAINMVLQFMALIVTLFHGTTLDYSLGYEAYTLTTILGSYIMTRFHNPTGILVTNIVLKFSIFPLFLLHNPLIIIYQGFAIAFADSLISNLYYVALRSASGDEYLGSIIGFDEFVANLSRSSTGFVAGFLYAISSLDIMTLGLGIMAVSTIMYFRYKELRELKL
ncbi:MAG: MFS transporter [Sulfolobaceae archaeon]|nr:MFS transporter [Sulfolobaceae archaeon]